MKRIAVIAVAAALFATTGAVALAAETETDAEPGATRVLTEAQLWGITLQAGYLQKLFGVSANTITDLRTGDTVIGWGAIFRLLQLADGGDLSDPLAKIANDGEPRGWAFGYRFKALEREHPNKSDDGTPKNFGQLMKQGRELRGNQGQNQSP